MSCAPCVLYLCPVPVWCSSLTSAFAYPSAAVAGAGLEPAVKHAVLGSGLVFNVWYKL